MKFIFLALYISVHTFSCSAQHVQTLKKYCSGFETIRSESFRFLDNEMDDIRIFGLGENTHGTSEFTLLARELMSYLSTYHQVKILIIETPFGEGRYLNDYIQGKNDDLHFIMNHNNSSWRYRTREFYDLMEWLRTYNIGHTNKLVIHGCEMQYVASDLEKINEYLMAVGYLNRFTGFDKHLWQEITVEEQVEYFTTYVDLKRLFINHEIDFVRLSSQRDYELAYHNVVVLGQFVSAIIQNTEQRKHDFRDMYIGENIEWIMNFYGHGSRSMYWAHNSHVGDWVSNGIVDVAGHQLRKVYGETYFSIATDFGYGEYLAFTQDWEMAVHTRDHIIDGSFTQQLKSCGRANTFLNLREAKKDPMIEDYLNDPLITMAGAGAQVRRDKTETDLRGRAFDAIIYINRTSKINLISQKH